MRIEVSLSIPLYYQSLGILLSASGLAFVALVAAGELSGLFLLIANILTSIGVVYLINLSLRFARSLCAGGLLLGVIGSSLETMQPGSNISFLCFATMLQSLWLLMLNFTVLRSKLLCKNGR